MDIEKLQYERVTVESEGHVTLQGVEAQNLIECCDDDGVEELLDALGKDRCVEHFGIIEKECEN